MPLVAPEALAGRRTFTSDDVFFSSTDVKGVITHANGTFLRLAHLTADEAIGAPHNVVRHPEMPGGIFRLVWDELEAGRPVCSYMANQARDGVRYDVLATFTPIEGGYLSIRLRPTVEDLELAVLGAYDTASAREAQARTDGASRHDAAGIGADALLGELGALGLGSVADLTRHVLPREIDAFLQASPSAAPVDDAVGPLGYVLTSARRTGRLAAAFAERLGEFERLASRILAEREAIAPAVAEVAALRREFTRTGDLLAAVVRETGSATTAERTDLVDHNRALAGWAEAAVTGLDALPTVMEELQTALRDLALRVSMFVLLSHMITRFTAEVSASGLDRGTELRLLHGALAHGLADVEAEAATVKRLLVEIPQHVETAVRNVDRVKVRIDTWNDRMTAELAAGTFGDGTPEVEEIVASVNLRLRRRLQVLDGIVSLATRLRQTPVRFDTAEVREELQHIAAGVAPLA